METRKIFNLLFAKRYFHLIAFKATSSYLLTDFWRNCDLTSQSDYESFNNADFTIELKKINSNIRFYNSEEDFSVNQNGEPPYNYDIVAIYIKESDIFIFGFPFKYLAKTIIDDLIINKKILTKGHFLKTDLNSLVKINQAQEFTNEYFSTYFSGLELTLTGDSNITSVNLDGDKPLNSTLYKTVFLKLINEDQCQIEKSTIRCETVADDSKNIPKTGSNIHIDLFGNFKLYIHGSGKNILSIPFIFGLLEEHHCLTPTLINPIHRLKDE